MVGTWMQTFAQGWVLTTLTSSALTLGLVNFAAGIPMLLLTMLGGSFADRYDKRAILHCVLIVQILLAVFIGWELAQGQIAIWHIFIAASLLGITAAFEVPAISAFVPELVEKGEISHAIAIDRSIFHATRLIGPAIGGFLIATLGVSAAYFINALTFLALILALLTIPRRPAGSAEEQEARKGPMSEGLRFVRLDGPTRRMVLLMAAMSCFCSPFLMIVMPLYARHTLSLGAEEMGMLMAISGVGSFAGSLGLLSIPRGRRTLALRLGGVSAVLALSGMAAATSLATACASIVFLTLGLSTAFGLSNITIQERAPDAIRGRVSAVAGLAFFGILPFSGLLVSTAVDLIGMRTALACSAVGYALCVLTLLGRSPALSSPGMPGPA